VFAFLSVKTQKQAFGFSVLKNQTPLTRGFCFRRGGRISSADPEWGEAENQKPCSLCSQGICFFVRQNTKASFWFFRPKKPNPADAGLLISSGWQDSNLRPPAPKAGAMPGYATPREGKTDVF
jgi:hypothetical protein